MFLLGDSHSLAIKAAAADNGITLHGGMIDGGRNLNIGFHESLGNRIVFRNPDHHELFETFLQHAGVVTLSEFDGPVICLFGMNIHYLSRAEVWADFAIANRGGRHLSHAVTSAAVEAMIDGAITFYADLIGQGCTVYSVLPPRRSPTGGTKSIPSVFRALEDIIIELVTATGAIVIDHRDWSLTDEGQLKEEYAFPDAGDDVHGSPLFGARVLEQICSMHMSADALPPRTQPKIDAEGGKW